jgi:hypothetical protein
VGIAENNFGTKFSVVFLRKPSQAEMNLMQKWAKEAATHGGSDDIFFNIIHLLN